jgi:hypothetical protein
MSKNMAASIIVMTLGFGAGSAAAQSGIVGAAKQAGQATKDVGKATVDTTKSAVETTGKATKKTASTAKNAVKGEAHAKCVDGTSQSAKTQKAATAACGKHGGVAK